MNGARFRAVRTARRKRSAGVRRANSASCVMSIGAGFGSSAFTISTIPGAAEADDLKRWHNLGLARTGVVEGRADLLNEGRERAAGDRPRPQPLEDVDVPGDLVGLSDDYLGRVEVDEYDAVV